MPSTARSLLVALATLTSLEARAQLPSAGAGRGTVTGFVRDSLELPIQGATVTLVGVPSVQVTAEDGGFRLPGIPAGSPVLVAKRIGFRPESVTVAISGDSVTTVEVRLRSVAQQVAPMIVMASRVRYTGRMRGFNERRDRGLGKYFTAADIDQRKPRMVTDLLRTVPGIRVGVANGQNVILFRGRRCPPLVWLDGTPATAGYLDVDLFNPSTLEGIEIYLGPSSVPSELHWVRGKADCGVIALWTKVPEARGRSAAKLSVKEMEAMVLSSQLYTADRVDTPAAQDSAHLVTPVFPDSLMRAAVGGRVVAEFVVDINGMPNMATFSAVVSTHSMFTEAVRFAVSEARFTPAWLGGKRVRQIVQLPFAFTAPGQPAGVPDRGDGTARD